VCVAPTRSTTSYKKKHLCLALVYLLSQGGAYFIVRKPLENTEGEKKVTSKPLQEIEFDQTQVEAVDACVSLTHRIVAVTGQAGTGKTTILRTVHNKMVEAGLSVILCAPTGKAAKRIKEATGIDAVTIHRLLEYPHPGDLDPKTGKALISTEPRRDRRNPIEHKVVLADEYAMVNTEVHRNLVDALPPGGLIRMFGDANQLQPIESSKYLQEQPSPFQTMLAKFSGHWLKTIHRQADGSNIIMNGARILSGQIPKRTDDCILTVTDNPVHKIQDLVMEGLDNGTNFTSLANQIIAPTNKGWVGTVALNSMIQSLVMPDDTVHMDLERHTWSELDFLRVSIGDKVIQTKNNYSLGVFNGETGVLKDIDASGQLVVDFGDKTITIPPIMEVEGRRGHYFINPQKDVDLAYVITTHKTQGSEYDSIVYVMNSSRPFTLGRKNFYTGYMRAKKTVCVVTDQKALSMSLNRIGK